MEIPRSKSGNHIDISTLSGLKCSKNSGKTWVKTKRPVDSPGRCWEACRCTSKRVPKKLLDMSGTENEENALQNHKWKVVKYFCLLEWRNQVYAIDSKSVSREAVRVRFPPRAPSKT